MQWLDLPKALNPWPSTRFLVARPKIGVASCAFVYVQIYITSSDPQRTVFTIPLARKTTWISGSKQQRGRTYWEANEWKPIQGPREVVDPAWKIDEKRIYWSYLKLVVRESGLTKYVPGINQSEWSFLLL